MRDPVRALPLAHRAVEIEPGSDHILDTLAETYIANGQIPAAIRHARQALAAADDPKEYYHQQLERFEQARMNP